MRLTEAQRTMLKRAADYTFSDGSGQGAPIWDGVQARTADTLVVLGLVSRTNPHSGCLLGFARLTELGRLALTSGSKPE
ncbi:hypothetical protein [Mesorhizobium sp. B2-3-2]|uniref:hypothetical protein n=1 Tax=Mesorhizobium sp. B2-3-2 TaxID=2589961 RepID=UPI00112DB6D8|nr:hypothetical protein [Mesorhizobium sp. B2-3-2]TPM37016.1 hypothetical protein FJ964_30230 [Mesorhizobium sp. B2-3-2]